MSEVGFLLGVFGAVLVIIGSMLFRNIWSLQSFGLQPEQWKQRTYVIVLITGFPLFVVGAILVIVASF